MQKRLVVLVLVPAAFAAYSFVVLVDRFAFHAELKRAKRER